MTALLSLTKATTPLVRFVLLKWSRLYPQRTNRTLFRLVRVFDEFTEDNDPWKEHDFGSVKFKGGKYFWKIDYYAPDLKIRIRRRLAIPQGHHPSNDADAHQRVLVLLSSHPGFQAGGPSLVSDWYNDNNLGDNDMTSIASY